MYTTSIVYKRSRRKNSNYSAENSIDNHWAGGQPNNRPESETGLQQFAGALPITTVNTTHFVSGFNDLPVSSFGMEFYQPGFVMVCYSVCNTNCYNYLSSH